MSDALSIEEVNRIRDEKIVHGYVRNCFMTKNRIPTDIINLCFIFYHIVIKETFKHYNPGNYQLSNDDQTLTVIANHCWSTCYGSQCISSLDKCSYSWKFKLLQITSYIAIGIDETKYIRKDNGHFNDQKDGSNLYALWSNRRLNRWDEKRLIKAEDAPIFDKDDIICMTLDLSNRTLSYQKNNDEKYIPFKDIIVGEDIEYCRAVFIWKGGDCVELLSCEMS